MGKSGKSFHIPGALPGRVQATLRSLFKGNNFYNLSAPLPVDELLACFRARL